MVRVDFYTLAEGYPGDRFLFACRLIEKIRAKALRVLVYCPDAAQAEAFDRLLWTFREDSFLPHGRVGRVDAGLTPVLISGDGEPASEQQVLVNLGWEVPAFVARFARVCEPIDQTPEVIAAGRRRWAHYRDQSYRLEHHRVGR